MNKGKEIFDGFYHGLLGQLNLLSKENRKLALARAAICKQCPLLHKGRCSKHRSGKNIVTGVETQGCNCFVAAKTMSNLRQIENGGNCPLDKW